MAESQAESRTGWSCGAWLILMPVAYVLSSGPMLGLGFWLRETTGWDRFYGVMWLYWPLIAGIHDSFWGVSIEWWVIDVFHTVGPG